MRATPGKEMEDVEARAKSLLNMDLTLRERMEEGFDGLVRANGLLFRTIGLAIGATAVLDVYMNGIVNSELLLESHTAFVESMQVHYPEFRETFTEGSAMRTLLYSGAGAGLMYLYGGFLSAIAESNPKIYRKSVKFLAKVGTPWYAHYNFLPDHPEDVIPIDDDQE